MFTGVWRGNPGMPETVRRLRGVLDGQAKFLREKDLALWGHQPYLVRRVREFLHFAGERRPAWRSRGGSENLSDGEDGEDRRAEEFGPVAELPVYVASERKAGERHQARDHPDNDAGQDHPGLDQPVSHADG